MQTLERPVQALVGVGHERRGQPIEQLGMRRLFAQLAEVARRAHQCLAEVPQPDAIDEHTGRERIVAAGHGVGQVEPAAAVQVKREADASPAFRRNRRGAQAPKLQADCRELASGMSDWSSVSATVCASGYAGGGCSSSRLSLAFKEWQPRPVLPRSVSLRSSFLAARLSASCLNLAHPGSREPGS